MESIPEGSAFQLRSDLPPVDLVRCCQLLRQLLFHQALRGTAGYDDRMESTYRRLRTFVLADARWESCLGHLARDAERLLPASLSEFLEGSVRDWDTPFTGGEAKLVKLQGAMQAALEAAGLAPSFEPSAQASPATDARAGAAHGRAGEPNKAQRRAEQRRARAIGLREQGLMVKEIARALGCSERAVFSYLQDVK